MYKKLWIHVIHAAIEVSTQLCMFRLLKIKVVERLHTGRILLLLKGYCILRANSAQYGAGGASSAKRTEDERDHIYLFIYLFILCYLFGAMKSVWTAPRVQFDPRFGVGVVRASRLMRRASFPNPKP